MTDKNDLPKRVWIKVFEESNGSTSYMLTYKADNEGVEYVPKSNTDKETVKRAKLAYGFGKTDGTKNIRAIRDKYINIFAFKNDMTPPDRVIIEIWEAILADLKQVDRKGG
jgi:hypothetical protein